MGNQGLNLFRDLPEFQSELVDFLCLSGIRTDLLEPVGYTDGIGDVLA